MAYMKRGIVLINKETGERKDFDSVNAAAIFLGVNFSSVQKAALSNGARGGWTVYESEDTIRKHIAALQAQLKVLENS